jgi:two-component system, NtrC family, sensor histidine kinase PilS
MFADTDESPNTTIASRFGSLKGRLIWVMLLRVGLISILLSATLVLNYRTEQGFDAPSSRFLLALIALTYLGTIFYALWYRLGRAPALLARVQIVADLFFWGCLTYATGGIASGFSFLFDLWVIVAAIVLGGRAAYYTAAVSVVILSILSFAMYAGVLHPIPDQIAAKATVGEVSYFIGINLVSLFIVAGLVNSLVSRLESTGIGLEVERTRRADLTQLHADMIHSLTVGLATTGLDGEILTMNPAGMEILGVKQAGIEGQHLGNWLLDLSKQLHAENSLRSRGLGTALKPDKKRVPVEYIVAPLVAAEGSRKGFIVVFSDLTEVRRLEAALERSRRLAALGELAASLAHEIRNPLGAVSGSFQMLVQNQKMSEEDSSLADIVSRELRRMERLVGDMLDYARPRQLNYVATDAGILVEEIIKAFRLGDEVVGRDIVLTVDDSPMADIDGAQIRQVLWNLLRNAAQATEPGDRISIDARVVDKYLVIEIGDNGIGVLEENVEEIFTPFFSTRERGLGLGLALCRRIVEDHSGEIKAEPRTGGGSLFRIKLPCKHKWSSVPPAAVS